MGLSETARTIKGHGQCAWSELLWSLYCLKLVWVGGWVVVSVSFYFLFLCQSEVYTGSREV